MSFNIDYNPDKYEILKTNFGYCSQCNETTLWKTEDHITKCIKCDTIVKKSFKGEI